MKRRLAILLLSAAVLRLHAQGFINLNFESAKFVPYEGSSFATATNALPGWIPYLSGFPAAYVGSNGVSLGGPMVSVHGSNNFQGYPPVQGKYFIFLQGGFSGSIAPAAIGQTGQIPLSAQSILFWGGISTGVQISFNNNPLSFAVIGTTNTYNIYQADIYPYAGQTGELLFFSPHNTGGIIDNIQFSSTAVPEPSTTAFAALGILFLGFRRWKNLPAV